MTKIDTTTLPEIGAAFAGGFFAGVFLDENLQLAALVVAPKAEGEATLKWKTRPTTTAGAQSLRGGLANSDAMNDKNHPAAQFCRSLRIGGHDDWYLPSRHEAALLAENLMPGEGRVPAQTSADAFKDGAAEAFAREWYWTSTEFSTGSARFQYFGHGSQLGFVKGFRVRCRAVRKVLI